MTTGYSTPTNRYSAALSLDSNLTHFSDYAPGPCITLNLVTNEPLAFKQAVEEFVAAKLHELGAARHLERLAAAGEAGTVLKRYLEAELAAIVNDMLDVEETAEFGTTTRITAPIEYPDVHLPGFSALEIVCEVIVQPACSRSDAVGWPLV
ncbi:hypothetical protein Q8F55_001683 [Vanrija albida]|uniref:Uncharacterized protein n=1 Tax=Vanrija albida TaxID=181172 RepID=A0ABR3Q7M9_9TREE